MELLCPVGNEEKLKTAVLYGADAVYLAGPNLSLRAASDNFSLQSLEKAVAFCHQHQVKVYVTLNAFFTEPDFTALLPYLQHLEALQVDGLIVSDLGVISLIVQKTSLAVHVSTQATVLNPYQADFYKDLGVKRLILGREASLAEAARIKDATGLELELFIHGAMCMAFSGGCVISNYTAGRDSNRGGCIQSCRHNFVLTPGPSTENLPASERKSFISSKDLNGLSLLDQFFAYGIDSAKIEGRMKTELYLAATTLAYKTAIERYRAKKTALPPDNQDLAELLESLAHRGYSSGSLAQPADATSVFRQGDKEHGAIFAGKLLAYDPLDRKLYLQLANRLNQGEKLFFLRPKLQGGETPPWVELEVEGLQDVQGKPLDAIASGRVAGFAAPSALSNFPEDVVAYKLPLAC